MAIIRTTGFAKTRRGLLEHVSMGRISIHEYFVYSAIINHADPSTGTWIGCAGILSSLYQISDRTCRYALEKLEKLGYLRRFPVRGSHSQYPILINKFECTEGAMKGRRLNAEKSTGLRDLVYEDCDDVAVILPRHCRDIAATLPESTREERKEKKRTSPARSVPPEELAGTLPLVDGSEFPISKSQISDWSLAYPGIDVRIELSKSKEWLKANPARGKTKRGILRFIVNWLDRSQNRSVINVRPNSNQSNPAKERIDNGRRVLAKIAIERGLVDPTRFDGGFDAPLSGARSR